MDGDADVRGDGASADGGADGSMTLDPCSVLTCNPGQRCVIESGTASCADMSCEQLVCGMTERCDAHPMGGHVCADNSCGGLATRLTALPIYCEDSYLLHIGGSFSTIHDYN